MGKKRYANDPLLYIHQPQVSVPKAPMQDSYITPKKRRTKKEAVEQAAEKEEPKKEIPKRRYSAKKSLTEEPALEKEEENKDSDNKRKQFKDMTTRERIQYFTNTSDYAPKLKCEVKTDKKTQRGIILEFKDEIVQMQVGRRVVPIPFEEIKQVRMIGF